MLPLRLTALLLLAACSLPTPQTPPSPASQDQRMAWWRDARFGMFLHWGLYAIPAGEWNGKTDYGEWIRDSARIPVDTYDTFQPMWDPSEFDAEQWVRMAAAAGMKYVVITSKHHDGFCLWDSAQTDWDVGNTPHARDILKELSAACQKHGVQFGIYHSIMDWHHPDYLPRRPWEAATRSVEGADFERYERYLHAQVTELIENYRPAVMWFDGEWESTWNHERGLRLFALCRRLAPAMLVNNRVDVHRGGMAGFSNSDEACGDFATPEQEIPATGMPGVDWESCMTMNRHWGWNQADTGWKSSKDLVHNLIDTASKGGNYLLNVGPRADGTFPAEAVIRLREIADWMQENSEAIHGTTASVFDDLPWGRCTVRTTGDVTKLYFHVFDWPEFGLLQFPRFANQPISVPYVLGATKQHLLWHVSGNFGDDPNSVVLPAELQEAMTPVVVIEIKGAPIVYRTPVITTEWHEFVNATTAVVSGGTGLEMHYTTDGSAPSATSTRAEGPIAITATCTLRAGACHAGKLVSSIAERTFIKVTPSPPVEPAPPREGLMVARFPLTGDRIDDKLLHRATTEQTSAATVTCGKNPGENVALRLTGFLDAPTDELYRFALASDDGSKLWIDGTLVVDNDGLHGTVEKQGARALGKGLHPITVIWFNKTGGSELRLRWARPLEPFVEVPESALRH